MDMTSLTLILAIITIVPTVGGLIFQAMKDRRQLKLDEDKADAQEEIDKTNAATNATTATATATSAASAAQNAVISQLQDQVERQNKRIYDLENTVVEKTTKIGELMLAKIDAESAEATMKYKLETAQLKLNALLTKPEQVAAARRKKEDTIPLKVKQELLANEDRKTVVKEEIIKELEEFKSGSSTLNGSGYIPIEGE